MPWRLRFERGDGVRDRYEAGERRVRDPVLDAIAMEVAAFARPERVGSARQAAIGESVADADHMSGAERAKLRDRHALARSAGVAAQLGRARAGGEVDLQAFGPEVALVGHHAHMRDQVGREMPLEHRLDVLAQPARSEDEGGAALLAGAYEIVEPGAQARSPRGEIADLGFRGEDLGVDGLDDAAGIEHALAETGVLRLPMGGAAEVLADLVPDVEERRRAVEVADD